MDDEVPTKTQQRILTTAGIVLGVLVGFVVFQRVIGNRMIEAPKFVLAVFIGGAIAMIIYTGIKDGVALLLKRRAEQGVGKATAPPPPAPRPERPAQPRPAQPAARTAKRTTTSSAPARPVRAERPLKPRD